MSILFNNSLFIFADDGEDDNENKTYWDCDKQHEEGRHQQWELSERGGY